MNVAVLGLGFMGATHLKAWRSVPDVRIAAVMSSDETKLSGDLTSISGNLGGAGEKFDFRDVRKYRTVHDALADPLVDVIDICLPTDLHAETATRALRAGKHVLVEKPIALNEASAAQVCRAAEEAGRTLMAAQVLRFVAAYRAAAVWLPGAGSVHAAAFRRRCAAPAWSRWLSDKKMSGGGVFDLLIHDVDYCISLWGLPGAVRATGFEDLSAGIDIIHAELEYEGGPSVIVSGGWHHPKAYPFSMDFTLVCDAGTVEWSSTDGGGLRVYSKQGTTGQMPLDESDPFAVELAYFADCVRHNREPAQCPPAQSAQSVMVMESMLKSRERNGEIVRTV